MNIILFNGPPSSGKDTIARHLFEKWDFYQLPDQCHFDRMSMPIKTAFAGMTGTELDEFGNNLTYEKIKEQPLDFLAGKSYRQWQIDFSEVLMKPKYTNEIFGRLLVSRIEEKRKGCDTDSIVIPDCGFDVELDVLSRLLPTRDKLFLFRLHRSGKTFAGDSRSYVTPFNPKQFAHIEDVENNDSIEDLWDYISAEIRARLGIQPSK